MASIPELPPSGRGALAEQDVWPLTPGQGWGAVLLFVLALVAVALTVVIEGRESVDTVVPPPPVDALGPPGFEEFELPPLPDAWLAPEERPKGLPPGNVDVL